MSISFNVVKKEPRKKQISVGLNKRHAGTLFQEDSDEEDDKVTGRHAVNQAIVREQQQIRASQASTEEYDFDGTYDVQNTTTCTGSKKPSTKEQTEQQKSRYIADMVQAAKKRKQSRDVVFERKVARDQAAEEAANPDFVGKDKFVTASYKRKLKERQLWQAEQDKLEELEKKNDVTKHSDGMMAFYGNFNKNVSVGGEAPKAAEPQEESPRVADDRNESTLFTKGFERDASNPKEIPEPVASVPIDEKVENADERRERQRREREKKIEAARRKYFERHPRF